MGGGKLRWVYWHPCPCPFPFPSQSPLCCYHLHLPEVLPPSFDPAVKPSPLKRQSCLLGLSWSQWNLFLQERSCLALGEEELAELRLFCAQRRPEALGQGVVCPIPPNSKNAPVKRYVVSCPPSPNIPLPPHFALSILQKELASEALVRKGLGIDSMVNFKRNQVWGLLVSVQWRWGWDGRARRVVLPLTSQHPLPGSAGSA